jgi:hypothetical protein
MDDGAFDRQFLAVVRAEGDRRGLADPGRREAMDETAAEAEIADAAGAPGRSAAPAAINGAEDTGMSSAFR